MRIPFNRFFSTQRGVDYIQQTIEEAHISGDGDFSKRCHLWLEERTGTRRALLTHSCTAALEMAALLLDLQPGDEVIMPSYTFVSTANAVVLRGAIPVFIDVREDTLNLDERLVESALGPRTRAICPVHYAGVGCEMDAILAIARTHTLAVVEDAAQGIMASYRGKPLGSMGTFGALSFHETKNLISGEGGALLVNDQEFAHRAEIMREKGTNRSAFFRGQVDKYTWMDLGSSFLLSDLLAAFLWSQFEMADEISRLRLALWQRYWDAFEEGERRGWLRRPRVPGHCQHNAHMFYVIFNDLATRTRVINQLQELQIFPVFHYVPLHSSPAGRKFGRTVGQMPVTDRVSDTLLRMPLWVGLGNEAIDHIAAEVLRVCKLL